MQRKSVAARLRSPHAFPVIFTLVAFAASRVLGWEAGVRFDTSSLSAGFFQIVDPSLLKTRLVESIWNLHAQPPLYNLLLGVGLKTFGSHFSDAAWAIQIAIGLTIMLSLYALLIVLGVRRWWAAAVAVLFAISPATLLFENWLFYEYLVAALLLLAALAFVSFGRRQTAGRSFALFGVLATLCLVRASFQIVLLVLVLAFLLVLYPTARRAVLVGAALPFVVVLAVYVKNWALFGTATTSSWTGMNLMQVVQTGFQGSEQQDLIKRGVLSPISGLPVFGALDSYRGLVKPARRRGIPVLDDRREPSLAQWNYNNLEYVAVSNLYLHDFFQILRHDPGIYFRGVWVGLKRAVRPSSDYTWVFGNRSKIASWARGYDAVVLWQPRVHWVYDRPVGTAWGIVAGYAAALFFGAYELVRVLRRRSGSATVAFIWLLLAYATVVMTFGEATENERIRFTTDPLVTVIVAVLAVGLYRRLIRFSGFSY